MPQPSPVEKIAIGVHKWKSMVPWAEANPERRAYCYRVARTIESARLCGQSVTDAANRLIAWWQVDNKEQKFGRAHCPPSLVTEFEDLVMAGLKELASD